MGDPGTFPVYPFTFDRVWGGEWGWFWPWNSQLAWPRQKLKPLALTIMEESPWCCCLGRSLVAFLTVTPVGSALSLPSPFKTPAPSAQTSRSSALSPVVSGYRIKQAFPASTNVWWFGFDPARSFPSVCFYLEQGMCHRGGRAAAHASLPFLKQNSEQVSVGGQTGRRALMQTASVSPRGTPTPELPAVRPTVLTAPAVPPARWPQGGVARAPGSRKLRWGSRTGNAGTPAKGRRHQR